MKKVLFNTTLNAHNIKRRDRLVELFKNYVTLESSTVLEIGCGNGRYGLLLSSFVKEYVGIDSDEEYVLLAQETNKKSMNQRYLVGRAQNIPLTETFDIVFYANSWHFIKDYSTALKETLRVLKPTGIVVILEPSETTTT